MDIDVANILNTTHLAWVSGFWTGAIVGMVVLIVICVIAYLVYQQFFRK